MRAGSGGGGRTVEEGSEEVLPGLGGGWRLDLPELAGKRSAFTEEVAGIRESGGAAAVTFWRI